MRQERGMATAELAMASLLVAAVVALAAWVVLALFQLGQCQATANEVARQEARGDAAAVARASADAPPGARVSRAREGGVVVVRVELVSRLGSVASVPLRAEARVLLEPGS